MPHFLGRGEDEESTSCCLLDLWGAASTTGAVRAVRRDCALAPGLGGGVAGLLPVDHGGAALATAVATTVGGFSD